MRRLTAILMLLAWGAAVHAADVYDAASGRLHIGSLTVGSATFANVVVTLGGIVSGPSGTAANGSVDSYDPARNELTLQTVAVGSATYHNVVVTVHGVVSIGGVSGADTFANGRLTIPALQQGSVIYTRVVMAVATRSVISIAGGMPVAVRDQYDPVTDTLIIPAVQVGTAVYTNVTVAAGAANIVSIGGQSGGGGGGSAMTFSVGATAVSVRAAPTDNTPAPSIGFTITHYPAGGIYYAYRYAGVAVTGVQFTFDSTLQSDGSRKGSVQLQLDSPALMGSGAFASTVTLQICVDAQCRTQAAGSPQTIAVTYTVSGNAVSTATWLEQPQMLNLESPSNGPALTATVNLTGYDLPPYGAYLYLRSARPGVIQHIAYQGNVQANGYVSAAFTLTLALPAQLGPGTYDDPLTVGVCYDLACTKQPAGTPWVIPFTYTVTASAGREFQQRILPLSAAAMAADRAGLYLYVATWDYNGTPNPRLFKVNAATGATVATVALPGYPRRVVVSPDGAYAYVVVGIDATDTQQIERVDLSTMTIDLEITYDHFGATVADVAASPLESRTIAVALTTVSATRFVAVVDDATLRPDVFQAAPSSYLSYDSVQWNADGSSVYFSDSSVNVSAVTPTGMSAAAQVFPIVYGDGVSGSIHQLNGLLYSDGGAVIDPATGQLAGQYILRTPSTTGNGPAALAQVLPDATSGKAYATYEDSNDYGVGYTLQSFSLSQYSPLWIARFPVWIYSPVRWGTDGLAFIALDPTVPAGYSVYVINGAFVSAP